MNKEKLYWANEIEEVEFKNEEICISERMREKEKIETVNDVMKAIKENSLNLHWIFDEKQEQRLMFLNKLMIIVWNMFQIKQKTIETLEVGDVIKFDTGFIMGINGVSNEEYAKGYVEHHDYTIKNYKIIPHELIKLLSELWNEVKE